MMLCADAMAQGPASGTSFTSPSLLQFEGGQLVDRQPVYWHQSAYSQQPAAYYQPLPDENPERLPSPGGDNCYLPWNPAAGIQQAKEAIPQYLPEGMLPPITGHTGEEHRAYEVGQPLQGTSWLAASHSAGMFLGAIGGTTLIDHQLEQGIGGTFGLRFGIDYDHRWGLEKRFGFATMDVFDVTQHQRQIVNLEMGDVDLLFYPWGDTRWRPYMSAGAGLSHFNFENDTGRRIDRLLIGLPFGIGVKYFWSEGVAVRMEMVDNLMLGAHELSTMNNISLAAGIEFRYSGFHLGKSKH